MRILYNCVDFLQRTDQDRPQSNTVMRFTAQEEYGLRCVLHLARASLQPREDETPGDPDGSPDGSTPGADPAAPLASLTVGEVAEREGLSEQYTGKLVRILVRAGLVESVRGRKGGYRLTRPATEIFLGQVLAALGGRIYDPSHCERYSGHKDRCVHATDCSVRAVWVGIQSMVDRVLSRISLADLICDQRSMQDWMRRHLEALAATDGDFAAVGSVGPIQLATIDSESKACRD